MPHQLIAPKVSVDLVEIVAIGCVITADVRDFSGIPPNQHLPLRDRPGNDLPKAEAGQHPFPADD